MYDRNFFRSAQNVTDVSFFVVIAISVGPVAHLSWTETLRRETESLQYHLGETEVTRVSGNSYVK